MHKSQNFQHTEGAKRQRPYHARFVGGIQQYTQIVAFVGRSYTMVVDMLRAQTLRSGTRLRRR